MQIIPLSEGAFTVDKTKQFIPLDLTKESLSQRPTGSILVEIQPFVVISSKDIILIDTGLGYQLQDGTPQLYQNLKNAGIDPSQITKVLISHLHKDHSGGITTKNRQTGEQFIAFPYATHYIQEREFNYATGEGSASYVSEDFSLLSAFSKVVWLKEDKGMIDDYIQFELTGAHCKYHQVFSIKEEGQTIFFGGDDAPQLQQMKSRFVAKYDFDGKKCMELRKQWWEEGNSQQWTFLFYHDISTPVFTAAY